MSRLALYIILGALRPRTSAARKVQIILPQTVGNTDKVHAVPQTTVQQYKDREKRMRECV